MVTSVFDTLRRGLPRFLRRAVVAAVIAATPIGASPEARGEWWHDAGSPVLQDAWTAAGPTPIFAVSQPGADSAIGDVQLPAQRNARSRGTTSRQASNRGNTLQPRTRTDSDIMANRFTMFGDAPLVQLINLNVQGVTGNNGINVAGVGGTVGRVKIAENSSPLPQDRFYVGYSRYEDVPLGVGLNDIDRYTPGFEKTLFDGLMSLDIRMPFASTFSNNAAVVSEDLEFGNMSTTAKVLLIERSTLAISGGLQLDLPTASDVTFNNAFRLDQTDVRYMPFLAMMWQPTSRFYMQNFTQFDIDSDGTDIVVGVNNGRVNAGKIENWSLFYSDTSFGYWLVRNSDPNRLVHGFSPVVELHYNSSLGSPTTVNALQGRVVGRVVNDDIENLNVTFGMHLLLRTNTTISAAYVTPVTGNQVDAQMDGEVRLMVNQFFGRTAR